MLQLPLRQTAATAKAAASLQELSGGRLILGVGLGGHRGEFEAAGVTFEQRGRRLETGVRTLRAIWSRDQGAYAQLPVPARIPVWIGGSSDNARRRAAAVADGWLPMFMNPATFKESTVRVDEELSSHGRDPATFAKGILLFVAVGERSGAAGLAWLGSLYGIDSRRFERHLITGPVDECVDRLSEYRSAGATHLALFFADDEPIEQMAEIVAHGSFLLEEA